MKWLVGWKTFEELKAGDILSMGKEFDNYFTVSFEFEIETGNAGDVEVDFSDYDEEMTEEVIQLVKSDLGLKGKSQIDFLKSKAFEFLDLVQFTQVDYGKFNNFFLQDVDREKKKILTQLKIVISSFVLLKDLEHLKEMVFRHLPQFTRKWSSELDFVGDPTLERGIEIKPKTYLVGIQTACEMLTDFFSDLGRQDYWKFTSRTGLHINVGTNQKSTWNPIKGILFLDDWKTDSTKTPYVFKDIEWRLSSDFCGSIKEKINKMPLSDKARLRSLIKLDNITEAERVLNDFIQSSVVGWGVKNLGFNVTKLDQLYVEFRYVGGQVSLEAVTWKLKYFALIVYLMTNREYKRKEYLTKLYKFIDSNF